MHSVPLSACIKIISFEPIPRPMLILDACHPCLSCHDTEYVQSVNDSSNNSCFEEP